MRDWRTHLLYYDVQPAFQAAEPARLSHPAPETGIHACRLRLLAIRTGWRWEALVSDLS